MELIKIFRLRGKVCYTISPFAQCLKVQKSRQALIVRLLDPHAVLEHLQVDIKEQCAKIQIRADF